jgi:hypothetical protein
MGMLDKTNSAANMHKACTRRSRGFPYRHQLRVAIIDDGAVQRCGSQTLDVGLRLPSRSTGFFWEGDGQVSRFVNEPNLILNS